MAKYTNAVLDDLVCQLLDTAETTDFWEDEHDSDVYTALRVRLNAAGVAVLSPEGAEELAGTVQDLVE